MNTANDNKNGKVEMSNHTISTKEIDHLATLGRIIVPEEEKEALAHELAAIVSYVDEISKVEIIDQYASAGVGDKAVVNNENANKHVFGNRLVAKNAMRDDEVTTKPGTYTRKLVDGAPRHEGDFIVVKKIIADSE